MNDTVGPVSYGGPSDRKAMNKPFSEKTGQMLDDEVRKMITYVQVMPGIWHDSDSFQRTAHQRTRDLLTKHKEDVEKVAKLLLEKEVIVRYV